MDAAAQREADAAGVGHGPGEPVEFGDDQGVAGEGTVSPLSR
ncbi:hypothetical protein [Actinomadura vinacea]